MLFFAKFEYALVRAGFFKDGRLLIGTDGAKACTADWEKFIEKIDDPDAFFEKQKKERPEILKDGGPKVFGKNANEDPKFYPDNPVSDTRTLIYACKHIRNNLIHGEKLESDEKSVKRNHALLKEAKAILEEALSKVCRQDDHLPAGAIFGSIRY